MDSAASGWGDGAPGSGMTGVAVRVLGERWVWPHAFFEVAAVGDRHGHVAQLMTGVDFSHEE